MNEGRSGGRSFAVGLMAVRLAKSGLAVADEFPGGGALKRVPGLVVGKL